MGYPSDLTDAQWVVVAPIVNYKSAEELYRGGRPRTVDLRSVVNALLYMDRTGVQWRYIPSDFPPSGTIRYYFDKWTWDGTWERLSDEREFGVECRVTKKSSARREFHAQRPPGLLSL